VAYASFKVIVKVDNVKSFSGVHKVKVKLDNGDSKTVKTLESWPIKQIGI
jgi:hypothetical protein